MRVLKDWWNSWDGPAYKWYKLTRWIKVKLSTYGFRTGNCAGCGKTTKEFDNYYEWFVCPLCISEDIAYNLAEHVMYPNGRLDTDY